MGKPSENDYDLNKSLGPFCSGAFGSSEGAMSAHRVSRCPSDCMHRWMYFALPCDALLVSPPANLAAGNTNIQTKINKTCRQNKYRQSLRLGMSRGSCFWLNYARIFLERTTGQPQTPGPLSWQLGLASWSQFCHFIDSSHVMVELVDLQIYKCVQ